MCRDFWLAEFLAHIFVEIGLYSQKLKFTGGSLRAFFRCYRLPPVAIKDDLMPMLVQPPFVVKEAK